MASALSVTVSIAAEISGMPSVDLAGQAGAGVGFGREDGGGGRHQQDVVEGERLADFHAASR